MKKLATLLAFSTVLAYGSMARAADLPEAPAVYDWTGFYLGGNIGYAFDGNDKVGITEKDTIDGDITFFGKPADLKLSGIFGGPEIGYNFQAGQVVFGVEGDFEFSGISDDDDGTASQGRRIVSAHAKDDVQWFSTIRGRLEPSGNQSSSIDVHAGAFGYERRAVWVSAGVATLEPGSKPSTQRGRTSGHIRVASTPRPPSRFRSRAFAHAAHQRRAVDSQLPAIGEN